MTDTTLAWLVLLESPATSAEGLSYKISKVYITLLLITGIYIHVQPHVELLLIELIYDATLALTVNILYIIISVAYCR